mgnify:CR=1 FL=1|tara:strand:+ start:798 stop:1166 length:369 start_codon:yes stop_codon:yes gene_type:complete
MTQVQKLKEDRGNRTLGTEHYWKHLFGLKYTDGVKAHADIADAYWLIDAVASYQGEVPKHADKHRGWILWRLAVNDKSAVLTARADSGEKPFIKQEIEYTDHPEGEWDFWQEGAVLIIPEEH